MHSRYLIIGSSHAALEAATAIRFHDSEGDVTLLTRDARLPYSPTILPYVVSGRSQPDNVVLRNAAWFRDNAVAFVPGATAVAVDPAQSRLRLESGEPWTYERLLIATGATPALPPVRGLADIPFHMLRSMGDAIELRNAIGHAKSAIVLGAGLIGMHAAENMAKAGVTVSVIELQRHVLSAYFEPRASTIIEGTFARNGVRMLLGRTLTKVDGLVDLLLLVPPVLLVAAAFTYLIGSYTRFLFPAQVQSVAPIYLVAIVAEVSMCLWLIIKGVNVKEWERAGLR